MYFCGQVLIKPKTCQGTNWTERELNVHLISIMNYLIKPTQGMNDGRSKGKLKSPTSSPKLRRATKDLTDYEVRNYVFKLPSGGMFVSYRVSLLMSSSMVCSERVRLTETNASVFRT